MPMIKPILLALALLCVEHNGAASASVSVEDPEQCDDRNAEGCSSGYSVEQSCDIQLFNLLNPTEERLAANKQYYAEDMGLARTGDLEFFLKRKAECGGGGGNFATYGKLMIGEYNDIARLLQTPQVRGAHLGRGFLTPDRLPQQFMLALDDPGTGTEQSESGVHQILHDFAWYDTIGKAQARINSDETTKAALESYITRLITEVTEAGEDAAAVKNAVQFFTCRYMMKALFDLDYNDAHVAKLQMLWQAPGAALASIFIGMVPDEQFAGIKQLLDSISADIAASPALVHYEPSENNFNLTREEWANELMYIVGIAAKGGGANLAHNLFSKMPSTYEVDPSNHEEMAKVVLEAGRIKSPVNGVNLILQEPTDFEIGGEVKTFPEGTVVFLCIALGSLDEKVFPDPHTFDHTRDNLMSNILNFNSVGYDAEAVGTRVCPGRNIAFKMAMDVLKAWLQREIQVELP
jgi:hypothetical protein